jgi:hypothetical protein
LWQSIKDNPGELDRKLTIVILRFFLPRFCESQLELLHRTCDFVRLWSKEYPDTSIKSTGGIRKKTLGEGEEAFKKLPRQTAESITRVARHAPMMLEITTGHVRRERTW